MGLPDRTVYAADVHGEDPKNGEEEYLDPEEMSQAPAPVEVGNIADSDRKGPVPGGLAHGDAARLRTWRKSLPRAATRE